jgi:methyltransferase
MTYLVLLFSTAFAPMIAEAVLSKRHERALRLNGAFEASGDPYAAIQIAYPAAFLAMLIEAWLTGPPSAGWVAAGAVVFALGKAVKYWAVAALGPRWSFRVLVLPGTPLCNTGPYRFVRHPNYLGVIGELLGMSMLAGAWLSGAAGLVIFSSLLYRRITVEEAALGLARG